MNPLFELSLNLGVPIESRTFLDEVKLIKESGGSVIVGPYAAIVNNKGVFYANYTVTDTPETDPGSMITGYVTYSIIVGTN